MLDLVAAMIVTAALGADPYEIGRGDARSDLLATPAPYPAGRTDSVDRLENGRLWVSRYPIGSRTPIRERVYASPGAASYGAAPRENHAYAYTRVGHQVIAFDPYATYAEDGFQHFRAAKNQWLRENGYVLKVRTHVNARYLQQGEDTRRAEGVQPRATIRINREQAVTPNRQAMLHSSWNPIAYEAWVERAAGAPAPTEEARPTADAGADTEQARADAAANAGGASPGA